MKINKSIQLCGTLWYDRKNGGYKIKYPDGTFSEESYKYKIGAQEACKPINQQEKSHWEETCFT